MSTKKKQSKKWNSEPTSYKDQVFCIPRKVKPDAKPIAVYKAELNDSKKGYKLKRTSNKDATFCSKKNKRKNEHYNEKHKIKTIEHPKDIFIEPCKLDEDGKKVDLSELSYEDCTREIFYQNLPCMHDRDQLIETKKQANEACDKLIYNPPFDEKGLEEYNKIDENNRMRKNKATKKRKDYEKVQKEEKRENELLLKNPPKTKVSGNNIPEESFFKELDLLRAISPYGKISVFKGFIDASIKSLASNLKLKLLRNKLKILSQLLDSSEMNDSLKKKIKRMFTKGTLVAANDSSIVEMLNENEKELLENETVQSIIKNKKYPENISDKVYVENSLDKLYPFFILFIKPKDIIYTVFISLEDSYYQIFCTRSKAPQKIYKFLDELLGDGFKHKPLNINEINVSKDDFHQKLASTWFMYQLASAQRKEKDINISSFEITDEYLEDQFSMFYIDKTKKSKLTRHILTNAISKVLVGDDFDYNFIHVDDIKELKESFNKKYDIQCFYINDIYKMVFIIKSDNEYFIDSFPFLSKEETQSIKEKVKHLKTYFTKDFIKSLPDIDKWTEESGCSKYALTFWYVKERKKRYIESEFMEEESAKSNPFTPKLPTTGKRAKAKCEQLTNEILNYQ